MPLCAQIGPMNITERTGAQHPLDTFMNTGGTLRDAPKFVDMDNDGDLDCFLHYWNSSTQIQEYRYLENIGNVNNPFFRERFGLSIALDGIQMSKVAFVDIDDDGDPDFFASNSYYSPREIMYYENTGPVTGPQFIKRTGTMNPLNSLVPLYDATFGVDTVGLMVAPMLSFVDIDNDGDMDCFSASCFEDSIPEYFWFYENIGTASTPVFQKSTQAVNPMGSIIIANNDKMDVQSVVFIDLDHDNDYEALYLIKDTLISLENTGTASNPVFNRLYINLMDSVSVFANFSDCEFSFVDIDNDNDYDVFRSLPNVLRFYENIDTATNTTVVEALGESFSIMVTYPNPSSGIVHFDKLMTGNMQIYTISGQEVYSRELQEAQTLNLSELDKGLYFMILSTAREKIRTTVLIE